MQRRTFLTFMGLALLASALMVDKQTKTTPSLAKKQYRLQGDDNLAARADAMNKEKLAIANGLPLPNDSHAVYFEPGSFPLHGDGVGDDAPALQQAIDESFNSGRRIVFVPEGTYRLSHTVNIWGGVRLLGYGKTQPTFVLAAATPGYQSEQVKYMFHFREGGPHQLKDGTNTTFFSGLRNVNIKIEANNESAVAIRFNVAQLCFLQQVDFQLGTARAAIDQVGSEVSDCRFFGGQYGIQTQGTGAWQFLLLDCLFDGQAEAAIKSTRAGLTIIRCQFHNTPYAVRVPSKKIEKLYITDSQFENISSAGVLVTKSNDPQNQVNMKNIVCSAVPTLLQFGDLNKEIRLKWPNYLVKSLAHGVQVVAGSEKNWLSRIKTTQNITPLKNVLPLPPKDFPPIPPSETWVNVTDIGAKGDGQTDDTEAIKKAIRLYNVIYFPTGRYRIADTLILGENTAIVGFHPRHTQFYLAPQTPGFDDPTKPKPMLVTPQGGTNILTGVGFQSHLNMGAIDVQWMAGEKSYMSDVFFDCFSESRIRSTIDQGPYQSLWITNGGGGTFKNIWSANIFATNGLEVSDTATEGRMYLASIEHHAKIEVKLHNVQNWTFYALQTEENQNSTEAVAVEMEDCDNITFANLFLYRGSTLTISSLYGCKILGYSRNIAFKGIHVYSLGRFPFDNFLHYEGKKIVLPQREAAVIIL